MHPGHLAPTYHQSMTDLALIEVWIVAQFYPEAADGDHVKHEQDDVQPAIFDGFTSWHAYEALRRAGDVGPLCHGRHTPCRRSRP